ncbi:NYN domain-containing protein [Corynebacterium pelargi]|uniref:Uncharacterized protein n=1 Tax=Corynebacterium pelargi TaxID=1471400 RepID=A0A410W6B5_9CORY|nr:hypothetical protein CPELA_01020 [Corynebacterium pelargi]GGG79642.1 hypothetical protein GCM10007338_17470 [Corynebacterium pelargi]
MSKKLLLVWDAPNLDMGLGAIIGGRPTTAHRPRFDAVGKWLLAQAGRISHATGEHTEAEATVFTNVTPGAADQIKPWVEALRNVGFAVFAKPKLNEDTDVDPDMVEFIQANRDELSGVVVASADGRNFKDLLEDLDCDVTVLGFREHATWALNSESINFVDLEDVPGVFREPLPRVDLDNLPPEGAWLAPLRPLRSLSV